MEKVELDESVRVRLVDKSAWVWPESFDKSDVFAAPDPDIAPDYFHRPVPLFYATLHLNRVPDRDWTGVAKFLNQRLPLIYFVKPYNSASPFSSGRFQEYLRVING